MTYENAKQRFTDIMEKFIGMSSKRLPDDVYAKLKEYGEKGDSDIQRVIYNTYFENLDMAGKLSRPHCQDTGLLHFYIKMGTGFAYQGMVADCLREATYNTTYSAPPRQNTVNYFEGRNTNDNTGERMPWISWNVVPDNDDLEIITYFTGGGCCLPGRSQVFEPSDGYAAIIRYVFDAVSDLGINACPPLIVGAGLGHDTENVALLSKKVYLRPLGTDHPHPKGAQLEQDLLERLNRLGIGAQGLRGDRAAMEVHIESSARHTATIAIGVNVACYAHRRGVIRFHNDLSYEMPTYKGVML